MRFYRATTTVHEVNSRFRVAIKARFSTSSFSSRRAVISLQHFSSGPVSKEGGGGLEFRTHGGRALLN